MSIHFLLEITSLGKALTLVRGPDQTQDSALRLVPFFLFSDLMEIEDGPDFQEDGLHFRQGGLHLQQVGKKFVRMCDIKCHLIKIIIKISAFGTFVLYYSFVTWLVEFGISERI